MADTPIAVTRVALTLRTPTTTSLINTGLNVTKADLQPAPKTLLTPRNIAVTRVALQPAPKAIGLTLSGSGPTWTLGVNAATISPFLYQVEGRRGIPVARAVPTLSPKVVNLAYRRVFVGPGLPLVSGKSLGLEENVFFVRAGISPSGKTIDLRLGITVTRAALSPNGQNVAFQFSGSRAIFVDYATPTVSPKTITLNKSWSLAVTRIAPTISGEDVGFRYTIANGVRVDPAQISPTPSSFVLRRDAKVSSTALSLSPQTIGLNYGWGLAVDSAVLEALGSDLGLSFTRTLELLATSAIPVLSGKDIVMYVGTGAPTRFRSNILSNKTQITFSKPQTVNKSVSERIRG